MFGIGLIVAYWSFFTAAVVIGVAAVVRIGHSSWQISRAVNDLAGFAATPATARGDLLKTARRVGWVALECVSGIALEITLRQIGHTVESAADPAIGHRRVWCNRQQLYEMRGVGRNESRLSNCYFNISSMVTISANPEQP